MGTRHTSGAHINVQTNIHTHKVEMNSSCFKKPLGWAHMGRKTELSGCTTCMKLSEKNQVLSTSPCLRHDQMTPDLRFVSPSPSILECWPAWTCVSLVQAITAAGTSWGPLIFRHTKYFQNSTEKHTKLCVFLSFPREETGNHWSSGRKLSRARQHFSKL